MKTSLNIKLHKSAALKAIMIIIIAMILLNCFYTPVTSYAETDGYSDVLTDLQADESFDISEYPANSSDYSLSVIQIAESEDSELFIYVYQPYTGSDYDLTATSINISKTVGENNLYYINYSLTLLSRSNTLCKYIVNDFTVDTSTVRYYAISSIYRTYYTKIDGDEIGDNTTSELAINVAQQWAAGELNGVTYYDMQESKTVTITAYAGFIRYESSSYLSALGLSTTYEYIDSHFIAFDCDYDIDELYEADISFYTQSKTVNTLSYQDYDGESSYATVTYGDIDTTYYDTPLTIDSGDEVTIDTEGVLGIFNKTTYSWDRICTVTDFIENLNTYDCEYDSDFIDTISSMQWVVRFYETEFKSSTTGSALTSTTYTYASTLVTDITILRLKFLSEGTTYNLGVVSNKISGSTTPDATVSLDRDSWKDKLKQIIAIIMIVFLLIICAPILPYVVKFIVWVISLPFKLISAIIDLFKK